MKQTQHQQPQQFNHNNDVNFELESYENGNVINYRKENFMSSIKSRLCVGAIVFCVLLIAILCVVVFLINYNDKCEFNQPALVFSNNNNKELSDEQLIWYDKGLDELKNALNVALNTRRAENVILFVGDGMGPNTVTASRIHHCKEEGLLSWEKFPHMGMLKTYSFDIQVTDSSSAATALFGGVKGNYFTSGVDAAVKLYDCKFDKKHHVDSIIKWGQDEGFSTGFVTNTRVTHATPGALYAHVSDRHWECEEWLTDAQKSDGCKDIGRILVEEEVGRNLNVIMGGGRQCLVSNVNATEFDPIDTWACYSKSGRNLIKYWEEQKIKEGRSHAVLSNNNDLNNFDTSNTDYVLGVFANGHLKYDHEREKGPLGMPSLKDMTTKALEVLKNKKKRFILVIEGGMIDLAHHRGSAKKAVNETLAMNEAVEATLNIMKDQLHETLIIVTADHSHSLTINGYAKRGSDIFGIASKSSVDSIPYTTLTYGTSFAGYQVEIINGTAQRKDPSTEDTTSFNYIQQSAIKTMENNHGGSDVTIHAMGPMAHLFHKIHENTYVAHVISYAMRIGRFRENL